MTVWHCSLSPFTHTHRHTQVCTAIFSGFYIHFPFTIQLYRTSVNCLTLILVMPNVNPIALCFNLMPL